MEQKYREKTSENIKEHFIERFYRDNLKLEHTARLNIYTDNFILFYYQIRYFTDNLLEILPDCIKYCQFYLNTVTLIFILPFYA